MTLMDSFEVLVKSYQIYIIIGMAISFVWIMGLFIARRYFNAMTLDIVYDMIFSFADEIIGIGAIPIIGDVGDYIGGVIIFIKERKISGNWAAAFCALEAMNFIIFSWAPADWILNLVPTTFIVRLFLAKYRSAKREGKDLKGLAKVAEQAGVDPGDSRKVVKKSKRLWKREDEPVEAAKIASARKEELGEEIEQKVKEKLDEVYSALSQFNIDPDSDQPLLPGDFFELTPEMRVAVPEMGEQLDKMVELLTQAKECVQLVRFRFLPNEKMPPGEKYSACFRYLDAAMSAIQEAWEIKENFDEFEAEVKRDDKITQMGGMPQYFHEPSEDDDKIIQMGGKQQNRRAA